MHEKYALAREQMLRCQDTVGIHGAHNASRNMFRKRAIFSSSRVLPKRGTPLSPFLPRAPYPRPRPVPHPPAANDDGAKVSDAEFLDKEGLRSLLAEAERGEVEFTPWSAYMIDKFVFGWWDHVGDKDRLAEFRDNLIHRVGSCADEDKEEVE